MDERTKIKKIHYKNNNTKQADQTHTWSRQGNNSKLADQTGTWSRQGNNTKQVDQTGTHGQDKTIKQKETRIKTKNITRTRTVCKNARFY